jgi:hypothetical protein
MKIEHSRLRILGSISLILQALYLAAATMTLNGLGTAMAEFDGRPTDSAAESLQTLANYASAVILASAGFSLLRSKQRLSPGSLVLIACSSLIELAWVSITIPGVLRRNDLVVAGYDLVVVGVLLATVTAVLLTVLRDRKRREPALGSDDPG